MSIVESVADVAGKARQAFLIMSTLTEAQRNQALTVFAEELAKHANFLKAENHKDLEEQRDRVSPSLYQRLQLTDEKINQVISGIRDLVRLADPIGGISWRRELDRGLVLEQKRVPIGVIGVIFEARPDAGMQILSLILKSGNAAILKGGVEATHSNRALLQVVHVVNKKCTFLPREWAEFLGSRGEIDEMLKQDQFINLVVPRGSQELVRTVMAKTKIPVLGHADGICHIYVEKSADLVQAYKIIVDAKTQYPSACNSVETVLVDAEIAKKFLAEFVPIAKGSGITLLGCERTRLELGQIQAVTNWAFEYGEPILAIKIVDDIDRAIDHINNFGSQHTDAILTKDKRLGEKFLQQVDSASVLLNVSTRFADGYRYGMGAEVGVSTSRTHARGPVGLEGLTIYKYILRGEGQVVVDYVGEKAKAFTHRDL